MKGFFFIMVIVISVTTYNFQEFSQSDNKKLQYIKHILLQISQSSITGALCDGLAKIMNELQEIRFWFLLLKFLLLASKTAASSNSIGTSVSLQNYHQESSSFQPSINPTSCFSATLVNLNNNHDLEELLPLTILQHSYFTWFRYNSPQDYNFNLNDELWSNPISLQNGTWRFQPQHSPKCVMVFVYSFTFKETTNLIRKSGHAHDDEAVFYIINPLEEVLHGFDNFFTNTNPEIPDIVGAVLPLNIIGRRVHSLSMYCHYCSTGDKKFLPLAKQIDYSSAIRQHLQLTRNGHGKTAYHVTYTPKDEIAYTHPHCAGVSEKIYIRNNNHVFCSMFPTWNVTGTMYLNITWVPLPLYRMSLKEIQKMKVVRTLHFENVMSFSKHTTLEETTQTKQMIVISLSYLLLYCLPAEEATVPKWDIYLTAYDFPTWSGMLLLFFVYSYLAKSFRKGLDMMSTFITQSFTEGFHRRELLSGFLMGLVLLTNIYQSIIATDFFKFQSTADVPTLLADGYKIRVSGATLKIAVLKPNNMLDRYRALYQKHLNSFYVEKAESLLWTKFSIGTLTHQLIASRSLLLIHNFEVESLPFYGDGKLSRFGDTFCTKFPYHIIPSRHGLYSRSYLSRRANQLFQNCLESGVMERHVNYLRLSLSKLPQDRGNVSTSNWSQIVLDPKAFGFSQLLKNVCMLEWFLLSCLFIVVVTLKIRGGIRACKEKVVARIPFDFEYNMS